MSGTSWTTEGTGAISIPWRRQIFVSFLCYNGKFYVFFSSFNVVTSYQAMDDVIAVGRKKQGRPMSTSGTMLAIYSLFIPIFIFEFTNNNLNNPANIYYINFIYSCTL